MKVMDALIAERNEFEAEVERLRAVLWQIKVDPHGHPVWGPTAPNRPVPEDVCPVCRVVNEALGPDKRPPNWPMPSWARPEDR